MQNFALFMAKILRKETETRTREAARATVCEADIEAAHDADWRHRLGGRLKGSLGQQVHKVWRAAPVESLQYKSMDETI